MGSVSDSTSLKDVVGVIKTPFPNSSSISCVSEVSIFVSGSSGTAEGGASNPPSMPCSLAIDILSSSRKVLISPLCLAPTLPDSMSANISEESAYPETRIAVPIDLKNSTIFSRMVSALGVISLNSLALYISAIASST